MKRIGEIIQNSFLSSILLSFARKNSEAKASKAEKTTKKELDKLWDLARKVEESNFSEGDMKEEIAASFRKIRKKYKNNQLDEVHAWPRYVKLAVKNIGNPIVELVQYVDSENYICLTKRLSDLSLSVCKDGNPNIEENVNRFSEAVYRHIVSNINKQDVPSYLALGRLYQKKGDYENARKWFEKILETNEPFNGITSILACYEEETKMVLTQLRNIRGYNRKASDKVKELNKRQFEVYEKWCGFIESRIINSKEISDKTKREYVVLMTGYARFERNRDNYKKAIELLRKIPQDYPDIYRVYTEEAMVYQFKPDCNNYYDLGKAIESFKKAEKAIKDSQSVENANDRGKKSMKSILMPMANAYYKLGKYDDAKDICDVILSIDNKEQRAINLKNQIIGLAS